MFKRLLLLFVALALPGTATARWKEARSAHFTVYSEGPESSLRKAVTDLEKYFFMLRVVSGAKEDGKQVPIRLFIMPNVAAVQETAGGGGMLGYYTATDRGPMAVGLFSDDNDRSGMSPQHVLYHELAHHFMYKYFPATYPQWYVEGFADYYGSARIGQDDAIEVGHAVLNRYFTLTGDTWLPVSKLLTARSYADVGNDVLQLYAEGWLLVHYLSQDAERSAKLGAYLTAINRGASYKDAAEQAFGSDLRVLDAELRRYSNLRVIKARRIPFRPIDVGAIEIRALGDAENALLPYDLKLGQGLKRSEVPEFSRDLAKVASRYPQDPFALRMLFEAQSIAKQKEAAAQTLAKWIAIAPKDPLALMQRGRLKAETLAAAGSADEGAWEDARADILQANKLAPRDPQILVAYYDSFIAQKQLPPAGAQNALMRALDLVPQSDSIRFKAATDFEARGLLDDAIAMIEPLASGAHDEGSENDKKKKKEDAQNRREGEVRPEDAREVLERLKKKRAEQAPS